MSNLGIIFLTGLLTGGLTCLAVQGGLLASVIASRKTESRKESALTILYFLGAKLFAYFVLGLLLGFLGSLFQLSIGAKALMQAVVAIFMLGVALNLLEIHPIFRYFAIQPPKFLTRLVRNQSKSDQFFAPILLGLMTIFVPCGTTQAMMALAIASGQPISGALILGTFVLGTIPLFFILGFAATQLKGIFAANFRKVAGVVVLGVAIVALNGSLVLSGSAISLQSVAKGVICTVSLCEDQTLGTSNLNASSEVTVNFEATGYRVDHPVIKAGSGVTMHLINENGRGCIQGFVIPSLGIEKIVRVGQKQDLTFKAPSKPGALYFSCTMGMYQGKLNVI